MALKVPKRCQDQGRQVRPASRCQVRRWSRPSPRSPLVRPCSTSSPSLVGGPVSEGQSAARRVAVGNWVGAGGQAARGSVRPARHVGSARPALSGSRSCARQSVPAASTQLWGPVSDHPSSPIQDFKSSLDFEGGPFSGKTQLPPDCDSGPCPALPSPPQPRSHPFPSHPFRAPFLKAAGSASKWPCHLEGVESRDRP